MGRSAPARVRHRAAHGTRVGGRQRSRGAGAGSGGPCAAVDLGTRRRSRPFDCRRVARRRREPRGRPGRRAQRPARRRADHGRPDPDGSRVRRAPAVRRIAGPCRGPGHLRHAGDRRGQPRLRPRDVPRRELVGHARLRGHDAQLGQHPLVHVGGSVRRRTLQARQRLHVREVPDLARERAGVRGPAHPLPGERVHDRQRGQRPLAGHHRGKRPPPHLSQQHQRGDDAPPEGRGAGHDGALRARDEPDGRDGDLARNRRPGGRELPGPDSPGERGLDDAHRDERDPRDAHPRERDLDDRRPGQRRGGQLVAVALRDRGRRRGPARS